MAKTFVIMSEYGEITDLAMRLKSEGHDVLMHVKDSHYEKIGDGLVDKVKDWHRCIGEGYTFVFDGCNDGDLQDWLRSKGEKVVGGSKMGDKLENDRQAGQKWFKAAGFKQPESHNFKSIDDALAFLKEHLDRRWILKQNGDLPKSVNHLAHFDDNSDLIYHLEDLKKKWSESEMGGPFDADLMEVVKGLEVAASAFFNGMDFLRNRDGSICAFLNFEEKKESDGGTGETTGEMGTSFFGCVSKNKLVEKILGPKKIADVLRKINFHGVFDINGSLLPNGDFVAFEPTMRFGVPATSYEFIEGMKSDTGELLEALATGKDFKVKIQPGWGLVQVIAAKPFPVEVDVDDEGTSLGEKLWPLRDGKPQKDFTPEQMDHVHLYNFSKKDGEYTVVTKSGYLLTLTGTGKSIKDAREKLLAFTKDNIYISGMKYRQDLGKRVEDFKI